MKQKDANKKKNEIFWNYPTNPRNKSFEVPKEFTYFLRRI